MKISDFDKVFHINFSQLPKLNPTYPGKWGNIVAEALTEACFHNLSNYFPECSKVSHHFASKVKIAIGLAFMRINEDGQEQYPTFEDFLICTMMSLTQKDIKNESDKRLYLNLNKLNLSGNITLAS